MSIDSAGKRISSVNLLVGLRTIFPDGSWVEADRIATARSYSGIDVYYGPPNVLIGTITVAAALTSSMTVQPAIDGTIS